MKPIPYVPEQHFEQIRSWLRFRNEDLPPDALPKTGFIIPEKCAGFLYRTDSSVAWIETLVAAPGLDKQVRSDAVDAIVTAIIEEAQKLGFKMLMGYTTLDAVVKRSERFNFMYVGGGFHCVALPLQPASK